MTEINYSTNLERVLLENIGYFEKQQEKMHLVEQLRQQMEQLFVKEAEEKECVQTA